MTGDEAALGARNALEWAATQARGLSGIMKHAQNSPLDFNVDDMAVVITMLDLMAERCEGASSLLS